jgi:hypothetical protein
MPFFLAVKFYFNRAGDKKMWIAMIATSVLLTGIQLYFVLSLQAANGVSIFNADFIPELLKRFFGMYYLGFTSNVAILYVGAVLLLIHFGISFYQSTQRLYLLLLFGMLGATIFLSVARVDIKLIEPFSNGPRYFFFPFVIMAWILLSTLDTRMRDFSVAILILATLSSFMLFARKHEDLSWRRDLISCACQKDAYNILVHSNGSTGLANILTLPGEVCQNLVKDDPFKSYYKYPMLVFESRNNLDQDTIQRIVSKQTIVNNSYFEEGTYDRTKSLNYMIYGSLRTRDEDTGKIEIKFNDKESIFIKTGPSINNQYFEVIDENGETFFKGNLIPSVKDWQRIGFFNYGLSDHFTIRISDEGTGWGEWNAVAVAK